MRRACIVCGRPSPASRCPEHELTERPRGNAFEATRQRIANRDGWICQLPDCGKPIDPQLRKPHPMALAIDHILPRAAGGTDEDHNLQAAHALCNLQKGTNR